MKVKSLSRVRLFADPMDCSLPGSSVLGIFPGKNTGVGCHFLLQEIFPKQGLNPGLPHCRQMLYRLSHQGSLPPPGATYSLTAASLCAALGPPLFKSIGFYPVPLPEPWFKVYPLSSEN